MQVRASYRIDRYNPETADVYYGTWSCEIEGGLTEEAYDQMVRDIAEIAGVFPGRVILLNVLKLEEPPADVRMSAEALIELQRIAAAHAVIAFSETLHKDMMTNREGLARARDFADKIQKGEISW